MKAIRSIGGILKQSQRLLLLWDPTYVERCLDILDFGSGSMKERVPLGPKTLGQDLEHSCDCTIEGFLWMTEGETV